MKISSRFGSIETDANDILLFPTGLLGLEQCRRWILLADQHNKTVAWLQSIDQPALCLAVVSPRRFVPGYQIRVARRELGSLELDDVRTATVLAIVTRTSRGLALNLKAPVLINVQRRLGRQVVTNGELPVRYELGGPAVEVRKSA
jgi:flagellar assembly factor FliW